MNARITRFSQAVQYAAQLGAGMATELRDGLEVSRRATADELMAAADTMIERAARMALNGGKPVPFGAVPMALVGVRSETIVRWIDDTASAIRAAVVWDLIALTADLVTVEDLVGVE